ncbi:Gamma-aminobutyric acid (GABA) B receptor [Seminavis robusta]|uniref:Gamma-aminobutyric acid (GABA) B receptor n=1 Tax=Seminavis robusta TaxID=568900 RepID=A0A9N8ED63_9STRA|nr:Gamma-aminobutyric acid (GABA) B receptor [Seminavis robusta]|eukprot:Sro829_g208120.1 Gamma-aminobutyric acid (GABA) B receptor (293) ;mRNA; r:29676-30554
MNLVPNGVRALCWSMAALVLLLSIFCAGWSWLRRRIPAVQSSQPSYLVLLCLGTFLLGSSIIPFTWQEPMQRHVLDVGCMLHTWLLSIGFSTAFSALVCKTFRIRRVVHSARAFRRLAVVASDVVWVPALVFGLNLTLLVAWTFVGPLHWDRITLEEDVFGRTTKSRGTCYTFQENKAGIVFGSLLVLVNLLAFLMAGYQSFKSRNLPTVFNESFYMTVTICIIVEAILIGLPIMVVVQANTIAFMVIGSWLVTVAALAVLIPLFWPKIVGRYIRQEISSSLNLSSSRQHLW